MQYIYYRIKQMCIKLVIKKQIYSMMHGQRNIKVGSGYEAKDKRGINCPLFRVVAGNSVVTGKPGLTVYS
jgi:hypothetical protein